MTWPFSGVAPFNFDSGFVDLNGSLEEVPNGAAGAGLLIGGHFSNTTDAPVELTLQDVNGAGIVPPGFTVPARSYLALGNIGLLPIVGPLKWKGLGIVGKVWGYK